MKLSNKQKAALEKVTSKPWDSWHPEAVRAYFAFTDRGQYTTVSDEVRKDFDELMSCHKFHPYTIECWKKDFRKRLLVIEDFLGQNLPLLYIKHACEIYKEAMMPYPIPSRCWELFKELNIPYGNSTTNPK